jgi:hypothetical protein
MAVKHARGKQKLEQLEPAFSGQQPQCPDLPGLTFPGTANAIELVDVVHPTRKHRNLQQMAPGSIVEGPDVCPEEGVLVGRFQLAGIEQTEGQGFQAAILAQLGGSGQFSKFSRKPRMAKNEHPTLAVDLGDRPVRGFGKGTSIAPTQQPLQPKRHDFAWESGDDLAGEGQGFPGFAKAVPGLHGQQSGGQKAAIVQPHFAGPICRQTSLTLFLAGPSLGQTLQDLWGAQTGGSIAIAQRGTG